MQRIIDAEKSDLFDVLAHVAYALPTLTRAERAGHAKAGITFQRFYFRLFPGAIKGPQIIEFLNALGRQIRKPLLVIWDGLAAHRSALVREYLQALKGAIQIEQLPAYAPELNPTEYIWGHLKHHELANRCAGDFADLKCGARNRLRSMQRRPTLIRAFWKQAELPL